MINNNIVVEDRTVIKDTVNVQVSAENVSEIRTVMQERISTLKQGIKPKVLNLFSVVK